MKYNPDTLRFYAPGTILNLPSLDGIAEIEDAAALTIEPHPTQLQWEAWQTRDRLKEKLRPSNYNGTMREVVVEVMEEPYARLLDARQRGWKIPNCSNLRRTTTHAQKDTESYIGLAITAQATSSGRGTIQEIQAEVWIAPVPRQQQTSLMTSEERRALGMNSRTYAIGQNGGSAIKRFVTLPRTETEAFNELHRSARAIGMSVTRRALLHPISTPIRD